VEPAAPQGNTIDPTGRFVEGLRQRGMYDTALEFLDQARSNRLVSEAFKETLNYQRAVTLMAGCQGAQGVAAQLGQLDLAQAALSRFIQEHPQHELIPSAQAELGTILLERGRLKIVQSLEPAQAPNDKSRLQAEARTLYQAAQQALVKAEADFDAAAKRFPRAVGGEDRRQQEARDTLRRQLLHIRLSLAGVPYDLAQTYQAGSKEAQKHLTDAAALYAALYEKYQPRLAAYYARLGESRCYKELGDTKKALATLADCLEQPDDPAEFRSMKTRATVVLLEALSAAGNPAEAIKQGEAWVKSTRSNEDTGADGLAIEFLLGMAWLESARTLPSGDPQRTAALASARSLLGAVSRVPGEYCQAARGKLSDPLLAAAGATAEVVTPAGTFAEAQQRGQEALARLRAAEEADRTPTGPGKTAAQGLHPTPADAAREEALRYFGRALRLAGRDVSLEDKNAVRYYLAYLYYRSERMYEAAVLAEFLARRYPNSAAARPAAQIAMAAYGSLLTAAGTDEDRRFMMAQMKDLAQYVSQRWPGQPEADEAEWVTGHALWTTYLRDIADNPSPPAEQLEQTRIKAQTILSAAVERMRKHILGGEAVTAAAAGAMLDLAQVFARSGDPQGAMKLLEDPQLGPLSLLAKGNAAVDPNGLGIEALKTALQSQLAMQQFDAAVQTLQAIQNLSQKHPDVAARIGSVVASLCKDMEQEIGRLRKTGKPGELSRFIDAYDGLSTRMTKQPAANFVAWSWAAETLYSLGAALDEQAGPVSARAEGYYLRAIDVAARMAAQARSDPSFAATPQALIGVQIRQARALRRLRRFSAAMDLLAEVLKSRPAMVDVQVEAAETYQAWGEEKAGYYLRAITGGREQTAADGSKENLVWGWSKISKMVQGQERFSDVFYQARYNIPLCRLRYANDPASAPRKAEYVQAALRDLEVFQALFPELGGAAWRGKYVTLWGKITAETPKK
jgi:tetratricopeptide (TPR) repeat protein